MEFDVETIKKEAKQNKKNLLERKNMQPPMCDRLTMSLSSLLNECDKVLFLCKEIEKRDNRETKLTTT
jgi:hypothetical protein